MGMWVPYGLHVGMLAGEALVTVLVPVYGPVTKPLIVLKSSYPLNLNFIADKTWLG